MTDDATASNIRTESHRRSHAGVKNRRSEKHRPHRASTYHSSSGIRVHRRTQWWLYFNSHEDHVSQRKAIIEASLSKKHVDGLVMIINRLEGKKLFTLQHFTLQTEDNSTPGASTWNFLLIRSIMTSTVPLEKRLRRASDGDFELVRCRGRRSMFHGKHHAGGSGRRRQWMELLDRVGWDWIVSLRRS
jgi:hypothetical protein